MQSLDPQTWLVKVSRGQVAGATAWSKIGYNGDVGTSFETVWTAGGIYVYPAAGIQMQVVSTSGNDAAAGTGVQQVQFTYLTTSFVYASEIVTMNGVGAVNTAATNIYRVLSLRAYRVGATIPAAAAGTISIQAVGGGVTYSQIATGQTRARNITYTVPSGKILYITSFVVSTGSSTASKAVTFVLRATYNDAGSGTVLPANFFMPHAEVLVQDASFLRPLEEPLKFPAGVDVKVDSQSDSAGAVCSVALRGTLVDLGY
jgi:hypothetical protein